MCHVHATNLTFTKNILLCTVTLVVLVRLNEQNLCGTLKTGTVHILKKCMLFSSNICRYIHIYANAIKVYF